MRIETSSMLVGSSASTTFGSTASARAIATRWRWPPDSSCGYLAAISLGRHEPDASSSSSWTRRSTCRCRDDARGSAAAARCGGGSS